MDNFHTKVISNEFECSTSNVKYKVEYHGNRRAPKLNQAEILAEEEEKIKQEKEILPEDFRNSRIVSQPNA